jgi:hypothetical protein
MNTQRQTAVITGDNHPHTKIKESNMKPTASHLIRWAGLAAMGSGILFLILQTIHPPDVISSVTTSTWAITHSLGITMCLLGLLGLAGLYARQVEEAGWLGLVGYLLFSLFYAFSLAFQFTEAFLLPVLATAAPKFVEGFQGVVTGVPSEVNLGLLPTLNSLTGFVGYVLGGLLFGLATLRARILPRWAGGLLAIAAVSVLAAPLLGHPFDRLLAVPMGLALACLGYALWSERREPASDPLPGRASPQLLQTAAE